MIVFKELHPKNIPEDIDVIGKRISIDSNKSQPEKIYDENVAKDVENMANLI
jgi:hypothetical protein